MAVSPGRSLTARLRRHVPGPLEPAAFAWWTPPHRGRPIAGHGAVARARWRLNRRRRTAELAQIVAHLTALVALGLPLRHALARTAQDGRGAVVDDLAVVDGWIRDGLPTPDALRRWAATTAWEDLGHVVAATVGPPCDLVARLDAAGQALAQRVHDDGIGFATLAAHGVWALVVTALVLALVA